MVQETHEGSTGKAIGLLLMGISAGLGLDLCAKELLQTYPLPQFVFIRSLIALLLFCTFAKYFGGFGSLKTEQRSWHLLRTLLAVGAMFGFFYGLSTMPLVDAMTLGFTAPLMMTALSRPMLGEHVGWRCWTAVVVGFCGVLLILRPGSGTEAVSAGAISILFAAFCYACLAITARKLASTESSFALTVYVVVGPLIASSVWSLDFNWQAPDATGWVLFVLAGCCSVLAWIGIVGGYRRAPTALLAPFEYTALIGGAIAGYLIWDEVPDRWVVVGALTIIGAGLFVVFREVGETASIRYVRVITASAVAMFSRRRKV